MLDEADEMLSRGFKDQIYDVFRHLNKEIQVRKIMLIQSIYIQIFSHKTDKFSVNYS